MAPPKGSKRGGKRASAADEVPQPTGDEGVGTREEPTSPPPVTLDDELMQRSVDEGFDVKEAVRMSEWPLDRLERKFFVRQAEQLPLDAASLGRHPRNGRPLDEKNVKYWVYVCLSPSVTFYYLFSCVD